MVWHSPALDLQRGYQPGHPMVPALSSWQVDQSSHGAIVGLLTPASIGADTLWNDGMLIWVPADSLPKVLWMAKGSRQMLADGVINRTNQGLVVNQYACGAIQAVPNNGRPRVKNLSCTDVLASTPGQRLSFTVSGNHIQPSQSTLAVAKGTTIVFAPKDAATADMVNNGKLGLYGGFLGSGVPKGQVPVAHADNISHWYYKFTSPGTYTFAIVPSTSAATTVPVDITVQVNG